MTSVQLACTHCRAGKTGCSYSPFHKACCVEMMWSSELYRQEAIRWQWGSRQQWQRIREQKGTDQFSSSLDNQQMHKRVR